jgi:hypothetical protein
MTGSCFRIYVRRNDRLEVWPDMVSRGNKYLLCVNEAQLKETVMKLFGEGWELIGIEEYI